MDPLMIIPGLIILASIVMPVVYINRARINAEKKLLKLLQGFAATRNCTVTEYELAHHIAVGIDKNARQLFYVRRKGADTIKMAVNLAEIKKCRAVEIKNSAQTSIERLELVFTHTNSGVNDVVLEFYDAQSTNFTLSGELQLVKKWQGIVNDELGKTTSK